MTGGVWYGITRITTEVFVGKTESKKIAARNEEWMRGACRETIIPVITAVGSLPAGGIPGAVGGFAAGKEAAKVIYPPNNDR